jgi:hypothetical protein
MESQYRTHPVAKHDFDAEYKAQWSNSDTAHVIAGKHLGNLLLAWQDEIDLYGGSLTGSLDKGERLIYRPGRTDHFCTVRRA